MLVDVGREDEGGLRVEVLYFCATFYIEGAKERKHE
jgi:hypothetical protein